MAATNKMIGTGVALAGLGGIAVAAMTANPPAEKTEVRTVAQPVETRTVVIRKVEHRVKRIKPKHRRHVVRAAAAAAPAAPVVAPAPVPAVQQAAPVVQQTPVVQQAPARTAPVRTRTSGSSSSGEHEREHESHGGDDGAEHNDD